MLNFNPISEVFNYGVLRNELKWYHNERLDGILNYETADFWMDEFEARGVPFRGHAIFWSVGSMYRKVFMIRYKY